jgi:hypothetical protein
MDFSPGLDKVSGGKIKKVSGKAESRIQNPGVRIKENQKKWFSASYSEF